MLILSFSSQNSTFLKLRLFVFQFLLSGHIIPDKKIIDDKAFCISLITYLVMHRSSSLSAETGFSL